MIWILVALSLAGKFQADGRDFSGSSRSEVKIELARTLFRQKRSSELKMRSEIAAEMKVPRSGRAETLFGNSEQTFLFSGKNISRLVGNPGRAGEKYHLERAGSLPVKGGPVLFKNYFHEVAKGQKIWFAATCYDEGYCEVSVSNFRGENRFALQIDTGTAPTDLRFFLEEEELHLMMVKDPCVLYRWTGTYFDQQEALETTGARSAAVFRRDGNTVIVVAQNLPGRKVRSKVFVRKNKKTELIQLLPTSGALKAEAFSLKKGGDVAEFVFVLNEMTSSSVYWWNGKELSLWKSVEDIFGPHAVYVDHVFSETFLFLSNENRLGVYRLTELDFDLLRIFTFDREISSVTLKREPGFDPILTVLTRSDSDPFLNLILISIELDYLPRAENQKGRTDPILNCLAGLKENLKAAVKELSKSRRLADVLSSKNKTFRAEKVSSEKTVLEDCELGRIRAARSRDEEPEAAPVEIEKDLTAIRKEMGFFEGSNSTRRLRGPAKIRRLKVNRMSFRDDFPDRKYLSLHRDEKLRKTKAKSFSADNLKVPFVNEMDVQDLIVKNKSVQAISGIQTLKTLKSRGVRFTEGGKINGISFFDIATVYDLEKPIRGKKIFPSLETRNLSVRKIDENSFQEWAAKILPILKKNDPDKPLGFSKLRVKNLRASRLNGLPWTDFLQFRHLPDFSGDSTRPKRIRIRNLNAEKLDGVSADRIFTKSGKQDVFCNLRIDSAKTKRLKADKVDGSEESPLKDLLENYNSVSEPLNLRTFEKADSINHFPVSRKFFGDIGVSRITLKNAVNISGTQIDLKGLQNRFWMKKANQTVEVPVAFAKNSTVAEKAEIVKTLNGNPTESLIVLDGAERPNSVLIFENVDASDILLADTADGNFRLKNFVFDEEKEPVYHRDSERIKFPRPITVKNLAAKTGIVDGIRVAFESLFPAEAEFSELIVYGNVTIENGTYIERFNGIPLDERLDQILLTAEIFSSNFSNFLVYNGLVVKELQVKTINGKNASSLVQEFAQKKPAINLKVKGNFSTLGLAADEINGLGFDDYLSRVATKQKTRKEINGRKTFRKKTKVVKNLSGSIDGFEAAGFERDAFSKTKIQNVTGIFFVEEVKANAFSADRIDGTRTEGLLFQDDAFDRVLHSDLVFDRLAVAGNLRTLNLMNRCDFNEIVSKKLEDVKKFKTLDVKENLSWENSADKKRTLSLAFSDAVKTGGNDTVSGTAVFGDRVIVEHLDARRHLNEFDLGSVLKNALLRTSHEQELSREVTFKGTISSEKVVVVGNALIDQINDLEILGFDFAIVKKNARVKIGGKKEFRSGLAAEHFRAGNLNGAETDEIVFYENGKIRDPEALPPAVFNSLKISGELEAQKIDGVDLSDLLNRTWTVETKSRTFEGNVLLKGKARFGSADVAEINGIRIADVVPANGRRRKAIAGSVRFEKTVSVAGDATLYKLNGRDPFTAKNETLSRDEDSVLFGNITFAEEISIDGFCEVTRTNDSLGRLENEPAASRSQLKLEKAKIVFDESEKFLNPTVFMHLEETSSFDLNLTRIYGSDVFAHEDSIQVNFRGWTRDGCGLPEKCLCPSQTTLSFLSEGRLSAAPKTDFSRFYKYFDPNSGILVLVTTTTVSYDHECRQSEKHEGEEESTVSWRKISDEQMIRTNIDKGFLQDVKFFSLGDSIYIVASFSFDSSEKDEKKFRIVAYELMISSGNLTAIDEISSRDSKVLEVFWTPKGIVLVEGAEIGSVGIYRFVEADNKFRLLRRIQTHGVLAVKSMRYKKESFIFVVQKQSWPLLILKYDHDDDNYHVKQKRDIAQTDLRSDFLSVSVVSLSGSGNEEEDVFVGVVLSDDTFGLFKYKHIEGFVETWMQEQDSVKMLQPFQIGSEMYLIGASVYRFSKLYRFVKQG